jgi:asparagine synthetase B (glutamine-hydrolysing)
MCGIAGYITAHALPLPELKEIARRMTATLVHRGPDDEGVWVDEIFLVTVVLPSWISPPLAINQ